MQYKGIKMKTNNSRQRSTTSKIPEDKRAEVEAMLQEQADKDAVLVTGKFKFYEVPGGRLKFPFQIHKSHPLVKYDMYDDQIYTIPLGVANHLNTNGAYPQYEYNMKDGVAFGAGFTDQAVMRVEKMIHRFGFQSLEFMGGGINAPAREMITGVKIASFK